MDAEAHVLDDPLGYGTTDADLTLMRPAIAREAGDLMKAMAHEGRLAMLCLLAERERSVTELEAILDQRQAAVSQQLARLRADKLVTTRREGKVIYYSLASERAREIVLTLDRLFGNPVG
jgi:DNA-binding transcriptional ArsR family regulator